MQAKHIRGIGGYVLGESGDFQTGSESIFAMAAQDVKTNLNRR
jgi:hypothetical protein